MPNKIFLIRLDSTYDSGVLQIRCVVSFDCDWKGSESPSGWQIDVSPCITHMDIETMEEDLNVDISLG